MSAYTYIVGLLRADTTLMAIGDIYPNYIPEQVAFPAMMIRIDSVDPTSTKDGVSVVDSYDVEIHFISTSSVQVDTMGDRVRTLLEGTSSTTSKVWKIQFSDSEYDVDYDTETHIRIDVYRVQIYR
jgi:cyclopropane fatty-acyl-phospholipid synthase-like methyltransferase